MFLSHALNQRRIQWFDKTHVAEAGIEAVGCLARAGEQGAKTEYRHSAALAADDPFANGQIAQRFFLHRPGASAAWVAHRRRTLVAKAGIEQLSAFVFVAGRSNDHIGYAAHIADIETACVGRAVLTH